ncbi:MAG: cobaltochelatase subunit CobN [archaeon]|nr:cobaltochelatase subunit CobN [archaeon]
MQFNVINITVGSMDPHTMKGPVDRISEELGIDIAFSGSSTHDMEEDVLLTAEYSRMIVQADLVIFRCLMDPSRYESFAKLERRFEEVKGTLLVFSANGDVASMYRRYFRGSDEEYSTAMAYLGNRASENDENLLRWELGRRGLHDMVVSPPIVQRTDGIYHPDHPRDITAEDYLATLDPDRPTVGYMFVATHWIYNNLGHVDALIHGAEEAGMNIIPIFFNASQNNSLAQKNTGDIIRRYFTREGRPLVGAIIMSSPFSQTRDSRNEESNIYRSVIDVPIIQTISVNGRLSDYEDSRKPGYRKEFIFQTSWAELDGQIISVPVSETVTDENGRKVSRPIPDRIDHLLRMVKGWIDLGRTPNSEKRVALILYQSRPDLGSIGSAAGLDGPESAVRILSRLKAEGYTVDHVPADGKALVDELLCNVTNNLDWTTSGDVRDRSVALVDRKEYLREYERLPQFVRTRMEERWGQPTGDVMTENGKIIVPGVVNGNVLITLQPLRAWMDIADTVIHDAELMMTHQYLGFYRWIQNGFRANAVIHLGTHGTLEWLPGKPNALSAKCCPDVVLNGIPNIYPFQMDDPGEGVQAKRRSEAVLVGYNCMPMMKSGLYGETEVLMGLLQEYLKTSNTMQDERRKVLTRQIRDICIGESILDELGWDPEMPDEDLISRLPDLNDHLLEADDELIRNGLHVLGRVPEGSMLDDYMYTFTRVALNGRVSLPEELERCGCRTECRDLLTRMGEVGYDLDRCIGIVSDVCTPSDALLELVRYMCGPLRQKLMHNSDELSSLVEALGGRYVMPGPSGAPTRSGPDILPSGRNYYGLDPDTIPSRSAWEIGRRNADQMLEKFKEDRGHLPTSIALIVWATDTLKTNGDDIAYALWLMGVRPVWRGENVVGLETIPLSELGRPRVDVSIRITGLFRDSFGNLIDLLDDAVRMVSELDEDDEQNAIAASIRREVTDLIADGMPVDEARRNASARIFGSAPGTYGSGMNISIGTSQWGDSSDLARTYSEWACFAYGRGLSGKRMEDQFTRRFAGSNAVVKNLPDKEIGMVDMDDMYGYLGGMTSFMRSNGNTEAAAYVGDTSDSSSTKVRTAQAALQLAFRSQVRNPRFIKGLMRHGYAGANEVSKMTEYIFGWDATSDIVEKWMYDGLAESYLLDDEVYQWLKDENPHALGNILRRLQEAIERGMWDADDDMRRKLQDLYIDAEERIEEVTDR